MLSSLTQVHVIFDDSASMYFASGASSKSNHFMKAAREEFDSMADRLEKSDLSFVFHVFSDTVYTGRRLMRLPFLSRGTNIAIGFEAMVKSIKKSPCEHAIIVFVSDGVDSHESKAKRPRLPPLPCKSTLLTVAVGDGFPTSIVVNELRVKYHTFGGDSIPLVFPLPNEADPAMLSNIRWVVSELEDIVKAKGILQEFSMDELRSAENHDADIIFKQCKIWYNACTIKCMSPQPGLQLLEKIELVRETKEKLNQAEELMRIIMAGRLKPLPSNLRAKRPIFMIVSLREKLNSLMGQLNKGRLFDELSDVEKQEYLSFGNVSGRFLAKSIKYNAANFETTKASLVRFVKNYAPTKDDEALMDQINICSWAEYMEDAKKNADLFSDMRSLAGVLESMPFIGRTVELYPIPESSQINPWVNSIKEMPMTLKTITTHDLYIQYKGEMQTSGEKVNSLVIFGGHPSCPGIFCHVQTFAITKNWLLYFNDSRLAAASMLVVYVLGNGKTGEWRNEELSRVRSICELHTPINSKWWHDYLDCLKTRYFRKCLVTDSPNLDQCMTCPGLGKFILGMWHLHDNGHVFTDIIDRFQATAVEFLGRCKLDADKFFTFRSAVTGFGNFGPCCASDTLDAVIPALRASHLTMRNINGLIHSALNDKIRTSMSKAREQGTVVFMKEKLMEISHFNLTLQNVKCFFIWLAENNGKSGTFQAKKSESSHAEKIKMKGISIEKVPGTVDDMEVLLSVEKTEEILMRALMIATSHKTSFDRNHPTKFVDVAQGAILDGIMGKTAKKSCMEIQSQIISDALKHVFCYIRLRHIGLPRPIPRKHVLRYKDETGYDIDETWKVDPETRLSLVACCFTACDLYLAIPQGGETKQKSVIRDHLRLCCGCSIPGLHRSVARNLLLPSSDIIPIVMSGAVLGEPFLPREVTRRLAKGVGGYDGVPRSFASAEEYKKRCLEIEREAMTRKIETSVKEFTKGDVIVLYHAIDDIKISFDDSLWDYSAFKKTFDDRYKAMAGV